MRWRLSWPFIVNDVLVTVGFLALFDKEFDLQIVAALLTIIGYSPQ